MPRDVPRESSAESIRDKSVCCSACWGCPNHQRATLWNLSSSSCRAWPPSCRPSFGTVAELPVWSRQRFNQVAKMRRTLQVTLAVTIAVSVGGACAADLKYRIETIAGNGQPGDIPAAGGPGREVPV